MTSAFSRVRTRLKGFARPLWSGASAVIGVISGLAPHVMHHLGLLTGIALFAGTTGTLAFGLLGLVLSLPFLLRLRSRFGTLLAPGIALAAFGLAFSVSTFVIGPLIRTGLSGEGGVAPRKPGQVEAPGEGQTSTTSSPGSGDAEHDEHHP